MGIVIFNTWPNEEFGAQTKYSIYNATYKCDKYKIRAKLMKHSHSLPDIPPLMPTLSINWLIAMPPHWMWCTLCQISAFRVYWTAFSCVSNQLRFFLWFLVGLWRVSINPCPHSSSDLVASDQSYFFKSYFERCPRSCACFTLCKPILSITTYSIDLGSSQN